MNRLPFSRPLLALGCALALAGCVSMAPRYQRPDAPVAAQFRDAPIRRHPCILHEPFG